MKLTQAELADQTGIHQTSVSKMEKGKIAMCAELRIRVCHAYVKTGDRCAILRRRYGKTLKDGEKATGVHQHLLSEMERGLVRKVAPVYLQWIEGLIEDES